MQLDAKAWIECALDHAFSVHLEDTRSCKATHPGLAHPGRIGPHLGREQQRFADRFDVQRHDDLLGHLAGLVRRPAIGLPMMPSPIKPSLLIFSLLIDD